MAWIPFLEQSEIKSNIYTVPKILFPAPPPPLHTHQALSICGRCAFWICARDIGHFIFTSCLTHGHFPLLSTNASLTLRTQLDPPTHPYHPTLLHPFLLADLVFMHWLCEKYTSTAAITGHLLRGWWECDSILCIARHSSLVLYALESRSHAPFEHICDIPLCARVLAMDVKREKGHKDALYILTDHPMPRLVAFEPRSHFQVHTQRVWQLDESSRSPAELGLTLALERAYDHLSPGRWALTHVFTGNVYLASLEKDIAFHARLDHAVLISCTFLERSSPKAPCTLACLSISSDYATAGMPVLTFYAIDESKQALRPVPWHEPRVALSQTNTRKMRRTDGDATYHFPLPEEDVYGAHYLLATPAYAGGGVLVFCEHVIFFVPRPSDRRRGKTRAEPRRARYQEIRMDRGMHVESATCLLSRHHDELHFRVLLSTTRGSMYILTVSSSTNAWETIHMHLLRLQMSSVATSPQGLSSLGEDFVFLASTTGDSVLWHVDSSPSLHEVYRWPSTAPIVDMVLDNSSVMDRIITASGAGPTGSLRAIMYKALTSTLFIKPMDLVNVYALESALVLVHRNSASIVQLNEHEDPTQISIVHDARVLHAGMLAGLYLVATSKDIRTYGRDKTVWTAPDEISACHILDDEHVVIGLVTPQLLVLHHDHHNWSILHSLRTHAPISCLFGCASAIVAGFWDRTVQKYVWPSMKGDPIHIACTSLPTSILQHAFTPHGENHTVVGYADGHVDVYNDQDKVVHTCQVGTEPIHLTTAPLSMMELPNTHAIVASGSYTCFLYPQDSAFRASIWLIEHVRAAACVDASSQALTMVCATQLGLEVHAIHTLHHLDIQSLSLKGQQPTSLTSFGPYIVLTTWPMHAWEHHERGLSTIRVMTKAGLKQVTSHSLHAYERPNSACVKEFYNTPYIVVGTGFYVGGRDSTSSGRLIGYTWSTPLSKLQLIWSCDVPGHVYGVTDVPGSYLVAAVDAQVHTYALCNGKLELCDRWGCAFLATCLTSQGSTVVVGDAMHSLTVLQVDSKGRLHEIARDVDPYWTTAVGVLSTEQQQYIGTDIAMNMFVAERVHQTDGTDPWSHVMHRATAFHHGDMVNTIQSVADGRILFGTASGSIGTLMYVPDETASMLWCVQEALSHQRHAHGDLSWESWRTLRTDMQICAPRHVLDAELLTTFFTCESRTGIVGMARHTARELGWKHEHFDEETIAHALRALQLKC